MKVRPEGLKELVHAIFAAAGCDSQEAECISDHLVESNLMGHDSHGVILIPIYIEWIRDGKVRPNQKLRILMEDERFVVADGQRGFGQSIGQQMMKVAIEKAEQQGLAVVALRNSGHLGRIGRWAGMAVRANKISFHFVSGTGVGPIVAPFGGISPRLSANPMAIGIPRKNGSSIILDISTSSIAVGKIKVALHKGVTVPDGCITDASGSPINDPKAFFGEPMGVLLPFGGHKGDGLGFIAELLAGALTGGGWRRPGAKLPEQGMFTIVIDPHPLVDLDAFSKEISRFVDFVKSAETVSPDAEILVPGELEEKTRTRRQAEGIELDETTWNELLEVSRSLKIPSDLIDSLRGNR